MTIRLPDFERAAAIIGDNAIMLAELSSIFSRPGQYLAVSDGPRMGRSDASNEIVRRKNIGGMVKPRKIVLLGLPDDTAAKIATGLPQEVILIAADVPTALVGLLGQARVPKAELRWPTTNLGVGLMLARQGRQRLVIDSGLPQDPRMIVERGGHVLIACESGDEIGQIIASNLAHSIGASFLVFDRLPKTEMNAWLEDLYLYRTRDQTMRIEDIADRTAARLPNEVKSGAYSEVIFITHGFPWGLGIQNRPTSHLEIYPDLGRTIVTGIWAEADASRSARTALVVDPGQTPGDDMRIVAESLLRNHTLVQYPKQQGASIARVSQLIQGMPFDFIAFATHATEREGKRITYEYDDADGRRRQLVVDQAMGFGFDPRTDMYQVATHHHFHALDRVLWSDDDGKRALPVGSAITYWLEHVDERRDWIVSTEPIERVFGAMAMELHDGTWFPFFHGFPVETAPIVLNNACNSWHRLAGMFMYAGCRAYIGALVSVLGPEADAISSELLGPQLGKPLSKALWNAQRRSFPGRSLWPYVLIGLPFASVRANRVNSPAYLRECLVTAIPNLRQQAERATHEDVKRNCTDLADFLQDELRILNERFPERQRPP